MEDRSLEAAQNTAAQIWSRDEIETIKRTVARDATDDELRMFLHLAKTYGLDPFARDIWFIKDRGGKPIIMTSRDGYQKIANRNPNYDNMDADVVYEGDIFKKTKDGVEHTYGTKDRGRPVGAYALVYQKNKNRPVYVYAPFSDYRKNSPVWQQYPHAMILKVAEAMALKRAFSISGVVTREEVEEQELKMRSDTPVQAQSRPVQAANNANADPEFEAEKKRIYNEYLKVFSGDVQAAKDEMLHMTEGRGSKDWTVEDLKILNDDLDFLRNSPERARRDAAKAAEIKAVEAEEAAIPEVVSE